MGFNYKKIIVIGNNGSGKSYFSKRLAEITNLPLIHLDLLYWRPNWAHPSQEEWTQIQRKLVRQSKWIIDGMHISTLEIRFKEADAIYFLDIDTSVCLESVNKREIQERTDFPNYLNKKQDNFESLIKGLLEFEEKRKPKIIEMHNKYPNKDFILLKTRKEINDYLNSLIDFDITNINSKKYLKNLK